MILKQATLNDIETAVELAAQFYHYFDYKFEASHHRQMLRNFIENPHFGSLWLLDTEGVSVGYLALTYGFQFEFGGKYGLIDELFVAESHRNLGFGKQALLEIQRKAKDLGLTVLQMQVEDYNQNAKRLYSSLGFEDLKRGTHSYLIEN
jgi:ribosomal protein S18 acetylase RimI-like enzyme